MPERQLPGKPAFTLVQEDVLRRSLAGELVRGTRVAVARRLARRGYLVPAGDRRFEPTRSG